MFANKVVIKKMCRELFLQLFATGGSVHSIVAVNVYHSLVLDIELTPELIASTRLLIPIHINMRGGCSLNL